MIVFIEYEQKLFQLKLFSHAQLGISKTNQFTNFGGSTHYIEKMGCVEVIFSSPLTLSNLPLGMWYIIRRYLTNLSI